MINDSGDHLDGSENSYFKSYFARSMAVNSQYKANNQPQQKSQRAPTTNGDEGITHHNNNNNRTIEPPEMVRLRQDFQFKGTLRSAASSQQQQEMPMENVFLQSQIDTLQWQLKQTESSREMYRAMMRQVVTFLERAHKSLEALGTRRVPRTQSVYYVSSTNSTLETPSTEIPWRWKKKPEANSDEVPPEKLSQEAYRLLRTAQSLLSTNEPDLAHVTSSQEDLNFLSQLAKEFPAPKSPQRTPSFSIAPKLLTPEKVNFSRKLSLQLNDNRRHSMLSSVRSNCDDFFGTTLLDQKYEKSSSPPVSSVGSAEDESGFSSMNSFQEVGIPIEPSSNEKFCFDEKDLWGHKRWSSTPVPKGKAPVLWV